MWSAGGGSIRSGSSRRASASSTASARSQDLLARLSFSYISGRPRLPADQRYENAYLFGAIGPLRGTGAALMLPKANTDAMQMHLDEISRTVAAKAHAVVLMDRAGWHKTDKLEVPKILTIILLPSRSPELNPVENIWQYLRQNWLSNRVFETYDAILDAGCDAWYRLLAQPETIISIGIRDWVHGGQYLMPLV